MRRAPNQSPEPDRHWRPANAGFYVRHHLSAMKRMTAKTLFVTCIVFVCGGLNAQTPAWQPSPGHTQLPIWPGAVPDAQPVPGTEYVTNMLSPGGVSWIAVCNVSQPTMTVYPPKGKTPALR